MMSVDMYFSIIKSSNKTDIWLAYEPCAHEDQDW